MVLFQRFKTISFQLKSNFVTTIDLCNRWLKILKHQSFLSWCFVIKNACGLQFPKSTRNDCLIFVIAWSLSSSVFMELRSTLNMQSEAACWSRFPVSPWKADHIVFKATRLEFVCLLISPVKINHIWSAPVRSPMLSSLVLYSNLSMSPMFFPVFSSFFINGMSWHKSEFLGKLWNFLNILTTLSVVKLALQC